MSVATRRPVYRRLFDFWVRIFAIAFGLGVVSGIVLAFEFGTNWSELSRRTGPIQGPLLLYETFTAFALEASFFGVMLFARKRVPQWFYLFSCAMVALGTTLSSFWIMVNNSWMQVPVGTHLALDGTFVPDDWAAIIFCPVVWVRFPHMLLAAYVTTAFCVAATERLIGCHRSGAFNGAPGSSKTRSKIYPDFYWGLQSSPRAGSRRSRNVRGWSDPECRTGNR